MKVIYLDESSELTQEELIEILRRTETGKIIRLSCVLSGEKGGVSYVKDRRASLWA